jgi:DNA relaxase NicK
VKQAITGRDQSHPITDNHPPGDTPRITGDGLFIDWLTISFHRLPEESPSKFLEVLSEILRMHLTVGASSKNCSRYFSSRAYSIIGLGNAELHEQKDSKWMLLLPGQACTHINDWDVLHSFSVKRGNAIISRIDLTIDVPDKGMFDAVENAYNAGLFGRRGASPKLQETKSRIDEKSNGRYIKIGSDKAAKMLVVYDKKLERGDEGIDETTRLELKLRNIGRQLIPLDILLDPAPVFFGAYQFLQQFGGSRFLSVKPKSRVLFDQDEYQRRIASGKVNIGQLINLIFEVEGSAEAVIKLLSRPGYPINLTPASLHPCHKPRNSDSKTESRDTAKINVEKSAPQIVMRSSAQPIRREIVPRVLRAMDAHVYLGMDRNRFNREVKPHIIAVPIGTQGIGYDRFDLDGWWEEHKRRNGRPGALINIEGEGQWEEAQQGCAGGLISQEVSGTSRKSSTAALFMKAVARATKKKRKGT